MFHNIHLGIFQALFRHGLYARPSPCQPIVIHTLAWWPLGIRLVLPMWGLTFNEVGRRGGGFQTPIFLIFCFVLSFKFNSWCITIENLIKGLTSIILDIRLLLCNCECYMFNKNAVEWYLYNVYMYIVHRIKIIQVQIYNVDYTKNMFI